METYLFEIIIKNHQKTYLKGHAFYEIVSASDNGIITKLKDTDMKQYSEIIQS